MEPAPPVITFAEYLATRLDVFSAELKFGQFNGRFLSQLVLSYAGLQEEGVPLFPTTFVTSNIEIAQAALNCTDRLSIGRSHYNLASLLQMFKRCAVLASQTGWAIFLELREEDYDFGLVRMSQDPLGKTSFDELRHQASENIYILGLS
ncbi:MAG: hypothetical protein EOP06_24725, partial [Proteobacteria bacterium]